MEEGGAGPRLLPNARLLGFFWLVTVFLLGL